MWKYIAATGVVIAVVVAAACRSDLTPAPGGCETMGPPGVLAAVPGIDLQVKDQYGQGEALGTTADLAGFTGTQSYAQDTLHLYMAYDMTGTFAVTLHRQYYQDLTVPQVTVVQDGCLVATTHVPVTLQLAPGAPPLRALNIQGATYLGDPRAQAQLIAHFDADPSVSRAVTWESSDTTLATVDANGLVIAKCPNAGGTVKITATTVATPQLSAQVAMSVAPFTTCS